jgi:hypothetical protein
MSFLRIVIPFYLLFERDLRAMSRLSRGGRIDSQTRFQKLIGHHHHHRLHGFARVTAASRDSLVNAAVMNDDPARPTVTDPSSCLLKAAAIIKWRRRCASFS